MVLGIGKKKKKEEKPFDISDIPKPKPTALAGLKEFETMMAGVFNEQTVKWYREKVVAVELTRLKNELKKFIDDYGKTK